MPWTALLLWKAHTQNLRPRARLLPAPRIRAQRPRPDLEDLKLRYNHRAELELFDAKACGFMCELKA